MKNTNKPHANRAAGGAADLTGVNGGCCQNHGQYDAYAGGHCLGPLGWSGLLCGQQCADVLDSLVAPVISQDPVVADFDETLG